ncbi:MAG: ComEC/Rec2 family competence protein [Castellaniella sp.]|uniref:ComEC/Rec2 family competence protein n=1 Tax=Castellaniella sp. TaxID=1955812 RepID=UPI002A363A15|nr:ComEC/Rec2 family competence protein [Castellaniella sp.]MDY0308578.1 ComEC/Rec2 family competence protein [Castellaniella sp.]
MRGRAMVVAGLGGVLGAHGLADLPGSGVLGVVSGVLGLVGWAVWRAPVHAVPWLRGAVLCLWAAWIGCGFTVWCAQARLNQVLADGNVDQVARVTLRVDSLPRLQTDRLAFEAVVLDAHPGGVPERIRVRWPGGGWRGPYAPAQPPDPPFPEVRPGQVWRMALVLRPVRAAQNFHAFDYEAHAFAAGIRAQGTVRGTPAWLRNEDWASLAVIAGRARHAVREAMAPYLADLRYGPVLRALAIGDQDGVDDADWTVFNRTGITHLVSISGSHITMLSGAGALAVSALWRRLRWRGRCLAERWPARRAGALAALLVAWVYCLLAGWGVPARRTFMMLAVVAGAQALQLRLSAPRVLALAAVAVVATDPWSVLAGGFWLSFLAVAVLLAVGAKAETRAPQAASRPERRRDRWLRGLKIAAQLQWAVTWALAPPLAWMFHEVSLVSPLANAYAIPVIELLVTPLSLLLAAVALVPGLHSVASGLAWLAHGTLNLMMWPTEWLAALPAWPVPAGPAWLYGLAMAGVAVALWPRQTAGSTDSGGLARHGHGVARHGFDVICRHRVWGWLALAPMLLWSSDRPGAGEWDLHALDVGQGSALLIRTARHTLLFDAGARHARDADEGARTVVPALKALGVRRLDALIVSHADLDHAGGARSVLVAVPVAQAFASFDLESWLRAETRKLDAGDTPLPQAAVPCLFGDRWRLDGVEFEFLWPLDVRARRKGVQANASSCVLRVRGAHHSLLLTGDIERRAESALVERGLTPVDVVVAAHHGSRTSSSAAFVNAVAARHVIVQAGAWNRHGHPDPTVLERWRRAGATVWRTDWQGGVNAQSRADGLSLYSVLESSRRYWHGRRP